MPEIKYSQSNLCKDLEWIIYVTGWGKSIGLLLRVHTELCFSKVQELFFGFELIDLITIQKEYYHLTDHEYSLFEAMSFNT